MPDPSWLAALWVHKDKIQLAVYVLLFLYCLFHRLPQPECICSGLLAGMGVVDKLHHLGLGGSIIWRHVNVGHLFIDTLAMACMFVVAVHANRVYPLWIAGAQIIAMFGHFYRLALEAINRFAYDVMAITPSYIQFVAIVMGVACHMSRRRKLGNYASWRRSLPPVQGPLLPMSHAPDPAFWVTADAVLGIRGSDSGCACRTGGGRSVRRRRPCRRP